MFPNTERGLYELSLRIKAQVIEMKSKERKALDNVKLYKSVITCFDKTVLKIFQAVTELIILLDYFSLFNEGTFEQTMVC